MRTLVKRLVTAVLLMAFAGAPSLARATTVDPARATPPAVVETTAASALGSAPAGAAIERGGRVRRARGGEARAREVRRRACGNLHWQRNAADRVDRRAHRVGSLACRPTC